MGSGGRRGKERREEEDREKREEEREGREGRGRERRKRRERKREKERGEEGEGGGKGEGQEEEEEKSGGKPDELHVHVVDERTEEEQDSLFHSGAWQRRQSLGQCSHPQTLRASAPSPPLVHQHDL